MKIKHKLVKEFQYITTDKKIFILSVGTILDNYTYNLNGTEIPIDKEIIENNPIYFQVLDWRKELLVQLKANKVPKPTIVAKAILPFIEMVIASIDAPITYPDLEEKEKRLIIIENDLIVSQEQLTTKLEETTILLNMLNNKKE